MRLLYLSHGTVPSRWAHSFQSMKMAQALAGQVASLELVTAGSVWPGPLRRLDLESWYGIDLRFRVVRLPVYWRHPERLLGRVAHPRFERLAVAYARARRPDLVYSRSLRAAAACVEHGLPTLLETHADPKQGAHREEPLARLAARAGGPAFLGLVTLHEELRERFAALGIPDEKLLAWPDAVDPKPFDAAPERDRARRELGLDPQAALAVYCGHLYEHKGAPLLLEAARRAPEIRFLLVGGTPEDREALGQRARDIDNLRLEPFLPNARIPMLLAAADVLLLPHSARAPDARTTSPLKLFEYMASRRPVLASRIPAFEGLLRDGENARLVEPDSAAALAQGVRELVIDRALAEALASQARRDVEAYTWERRAREILERFLPRGILAA